MTLRTDPETGLDIARTAALERLLNAYLRELGTDPRTEETPHTDGIPMRISLPRLGAEMFGTMTRRSPAGHHRYGTHFWLRLREARITLAPMEVVDLLLHELASRHDGQPLAEFRQHFDDSVEKSARYLREAERGNFLDSADRMMDAEQSVLLGHPFHPTPKSSEGFSDDDLARYAPELGAAFALHYFAVSADMCAEDMLEAGSLICGAVERHARERLPTGDWRLLPCHPWQARYLHGLPAVRTLIDQGRIVPLGALPPRVRPTSSVRTVLNCERRWFYKLPLNVRITNYVRTNPLAHLRRSLDVSRALEGISIEGMTVLREVGWRTVSVAEHPELSASFGVLFRETPRACEPAPVVVAALLERHGTTSAENVPRSENLPLDRGPSSVPVDVPLAP